MRFPSWRIVIVIAGLSVPGCAGRTDRLATVPRAPTAPARPAASAAQIGLATYYAAAFAGRTTASGSAYDPDALTAAHRTLAFGTRVRVTHVESGRSVVVVINDRGPFVRHRIIDLSRRAARHLGFIRAGVARVRVEPLPG